MSASPPRPTRIGIIGMGGFAAAHHHTVAQLEAEGHAKLICTCDPQAEAFSPQQHAWHFAERGVRVFTHYEQMIDACRESLDMVVVSTPINLHAQMHRAAAQAGLPVYLEKPATLDHAELEEMIAHDAQVPRAALVAFNFIIEPARRALKQRLLDGEFGALIEASLLARWPRPADYFYRTDWAGRLMLDGRLVLDSCFGNANAHLVHNMLFWLGQDTLSTWAEIASVRAELYRAHAIESADTFFVQTVTSNGQTLRCALTHACAGETRHCETLRCEKAEIRYTVGSHAEIRWLDGRGDERIEVNGFDAVRENHLAYYRYLRGEEPRPATSLADSRPFVHLNDLAYISSGQITAIPATLISPHRDPREQKDYLDVEGMDAAMEDFLRSATWPGSQWGRNAPGTLVTPAALPRLHDTIRTLHAALTPAG
ncbi:oxidoreductase [Cephaloticoccus primus]|uniref:Oxidoreductase n=1 Tax=Cephaloticoccus primus TaxID=1548207 RepID=A0A139ST15_9BACT|nr:Gfo/Idh/MocA family oxidoreductase [Cephaloticoccus primus]KXU37600.1 oxidoreductase [Cephaloticoccus primus]